MLIFQSFRLGDSYQSKLSDFIKCISFLSVNIEVSIEVCSDSVHFFRKFMSSTEAELINKKSRNGKYFSGKQVCKTRIKFTNTNLQESDITEMIPVTYVRYIPETQGILSNGEQLKIYLV